MSAESGYMSQHGIECEGIHDFWRGYESPERHASAKCFGHAHYVRHYTVFLKGEKGARATQSGLNLIEYEQRTSLRASPAKCFEKSCGRYSYACLALHRFDKDGGSALRYAFKLRKVAEFERVDVGDEPVGKHSCTLHLLVRPLC